MAPATTTSSDEPAAAAAAGRAREVTASMAAAAVFPLALNWTDVIKTRMQAPPPPAGSAGIAYAGFGASARRIAAEEGLWRLWGTALSASLLREVLVVGTRVGAYPAVRDALSHGGGGDASLWSKLGAGVVLGVLSGLLASPCDAVRIRLQAEAGLSDSSGKLLTGLRAGLPRRLHSTPHAFRVVLGEALGSGGLVRGARANVLHSVAITVGTVPVYEHSKHLAKRHLGCQEGLQLHLLAGFSAGLVGTTVAAPADVLRTRIMATAAGDSTAAGAHSRGGALFAAAHAVLRQSGPRGLLRGWVPAYLRIGPMFVLMPALIEQSRVRLFGLGYLE
jgi:hypothetical protein